jgi:two-component system sensor histidine kinase ChiS
MTTNETAGEIFLVDDNPNNLTLLIGILREAGFQVRVADRGRRALQMIAAHPADLILLDITMPDMNGYEVCQALKSDAKTESIPVLFISANDDPVDKVKAFSVGGVDYIPKPFQAEEVIARVRNHLTIGRLRRALEERTQRLEVALRDLAEASLTDPLTGLRNRRFLVQRIDDDAAAGPRRRTEDPVPDLIFFMMDVDHFKKVNDVHGHAAGDRVLQEVSTRLRQVFSKDDHLIRWGGEEFLVVARSGSRALADALAERARARVAGEPFVLDDGTSLPVTCSLGFACLPFFATQPDSLSWQDVVRIADLGLYAAKQAGRNGWVGVRARAEDPSNETVERVRAEPHEAERRGELELSTSLDRTTVAQAMSRG